VTLIDGVRVSGWWQDGHTRGIHLEDGQTFGARLVVAADGAHSRLRQWVGLPTREWDYGQQAIVCTVRTAQSHRYTAWQRFSPTGPLAFLPLLSESGDEHFCSIVWSQDTEEARRLMGLDDHAFKAELERAIERELGAVDLVSRRYAFPLRQRHAKEYIAPGFALVGDAAHTIHPLAGQGANLGYGDVRALLDELAWQRFSPTGPLAFLPLLSESGDEHFCSIVWSQDTEEARRLMGLDDHAFKAELERAIERELGAVDRVSRRYAFPLRQRHAKEYIAPGFALVGDAAHTIHPLAGQGANLGYGDVRALLDELASARSKGIDPDNELVLARYQRRRKGENLAMMAAMEGFKQLFGRDELTLRWLRNTGMRWLNQLGPIKNRIAAEAMGLDA